MQERYKIVRGFQNSLRRRLVATDLTLEEAQAHCNDPETSSSTATGAVARARTKRNGPWFDRYERIS
jgi:hypothetical protein